MGHSRITLAILFALGLTGTAQADEPGQDPFMVELKGPDEPAPSAVQPEAHSAPLPPKVQSVARQPASGSMGSYGPIRPTDTLWSLANKYRPSSQVSVYQTMVAIYDKNPRSFADGNINHLLVGSRILLPSAGEAGRISDLEARHRFKSDNASWKGLSPKYLAGKHYQVKPVAAHPDEAKVAAAPAPASKAAPVPVAAPKVSSPQPVGEVKEVVKAAVPVPSQAVATSAAVSASLPATVVPVGKPETEMALALEDANAQLGQVTEMNQRLKLRLQSLTEEVETFKAQLEEQTALEKEIATLKAKAVPPAQAPAPRQGEQSELMALAASPLNLAMIILLPVLLVLALVTLWLRARARRELEEQELRLSESTAMVMGDEKSEFEQLMTAGIADDMPPGPQAQRNSPDDLVFQDDEEETLAPAQAGDVLMEEAIGEEALQTPQFAELDADLAHHDGEALAGRTQEDLASFDLSDFAGALTDSDRAQALREEVEEEDRVDELLIERSLSEATAAEPSWQGDELALAGFGDGFAELSSQPAAVPDHEAVQDQAEPHGYVEITKLLAEAEASNSEQEPYRGFSLDVGLDGFPEVLPASNGVDVDVDDGGVGAKLDLARAYLEIDDKENAIELLQEAATKGSEHQRTEAQRLLKRLG